MITPAPQTLDVTGLPPEAVAAVAAVVEQLRTTHTPPPDRQTHLRDGETPEQRVARFDEWVKSRVSRNPNMDDSRDSIYD